jgi:transcription elongation factor Elf1
MAALFYLGGTAAGAEPETLDKLAQTGLAVGGIVGAAAAARGGVNPIRPPMQGERPLIQQAVRLPEPIQRPGIRPPVPPPPPQVNGLVVRTYTTLDWTVVVPIKGKYKGENRYDHVRRHNVDDTTKPNHGIFKEDGVATTNAAWNRAQDLGLKPNSAGELIVPMGETVGISGGALGTGLPLNSVRILVQPTTNNIITSMPY